MAKLSSRLGEKALRQALRHRLEDAKGPDGLVLEELGVDRGRARVDLALLTTGLHGFEIKSEDDTLDRLARQMHSYQGVFDTLTLVTSASYLAAASRLLPEWWGLVQGEMRDEEVVLQTVREPERNPLQDAWSIAALLWREEALAVVQAQRPSPKVSRSTRTTLHEWIGSNVPLPTVREQVLSTLRNRTWPAPRFSRPAATRLPADAPSAPDDGSWHRGAKT